MQDFTDKKPVDRRGALRTAGIALSSAPLLISSVVRAATPAQTEGPFHPVNLDQDLTRKAPDSDLAAGEIVVVNGLVIDDRSRQPLSGVLVELWQADSNGLYSHPADPREGHRDPNFQFWSRAVSDRQGRFTFRTIKPGPYPATDDGLWWRPPHLHWRFLKRGYTDLTTQSYFAEEEALNGVDRILLSLTREGRHNVIIDFTPDVEGLRTGLFTVELVALT